jgi:hypothetical protein
MQDRNLEVSVYTPAQLKSFLQAWTTIGRTLSTRRTLDLFHVLDVVSSFLSDKSYDDPSLACLGNSGVVGTSTSEKQHLSTHSHHSTTVDPFWPLVSSAQTTGQSSEQTRPDSIASSYLGASHPSREEGLFSDKLGSAASANTVPPVPVARLLGSKSVQSTPKWNEGSQTRRN